MLRHAPWIRHHSIAKDLGDGVPQPVVGFWPLGRLSIFPMGANSSKGLDMNIARRVENSHRIPIINSPDDRTALHLR